MKPHCREILEEVYLFLDGEVLSEQERLDVQAHLEACRPCFERYGLEDEVTRLIARLRGSCRCPEALKVRISALIRDA